MKDGGNCLLASSGHKTWPSDAHLWPLQEVGGRKRGVRSRRGFVFAALLIPTCSSALMPTLAQDRGFTRVTFFTKKFESRKDVHESRGGVIVENGLH